MSINAGKRKCSAVRSDGQACQAWAVIGSDPALCSAHAGLNIGAGAPRGNQNAMKHGLYMSMMRPEEIADMEIAASATLAHELALTRIMLRRMSRYLDKKDLPVRDIVEVMSILFTGVRTVAYLLNNIDVDGFDWDEVLDDLNKDWGIEI